MIDQPQRNVNDRPQLTDDHRVVLSSEQSYLGSALGINPQIEIDYRMLEIEKGDVFVLATDGVYAHVGPRFVVNAITSGAGDAGDLDAAARMIELILAAPRHDEFENSAERVHNVKRVRATVSGGSFEGDKASLLLVGLSR